MTDHEWSTGEFATEITVDEAGFYSVTAFDGTCEQTVGIDVNVNPVNSIDELELYNFNIYPNPTSSDVVISWDAKVSVEALQIFDLQGKLLKHLSVETNVSQKSIATSDLSSGLYFVVLSAGDETIQRKLIKQ